MPSTGVITIQVKRRYIVGLIILALACSFPPLINFLDSPLFQSIRGIDLIRVMLIGVCWGVAILALGILIRSKFGEG